MPKNIGMKIYASYFDDINIRTESRDVLFEMLRKEAVSCFMGIDPHSKYYPFCLWLAVVLNEHNDPEHIIYNEFPTYEYFNDFYSAQRKERKLELTLKELAALIKSYDGAEHGITVNARYADTRYSKGAGAENVMTNTIGMVETWKRVENGALYLSIPSEKLIDVQQLSIKTDLSYNKSIPLSPFNRPKLTVAPWCRNTIQMFRQHREDRHGKGEDEKYKDPSDALRILYAGVSGKIFKPPKKLKKRVKNVSWMSN
jgi:hypothetical protein